MATLRCNAKLESEHVGRTTDSKSNAAAFGAGAAGGSAEGAGGGAATAAEAIPSMMCWQGRSIF